MSERDEKRGGSGCAIVGAVLLFLVTPVLYVLSIGPAVYLFTRDPSFVWIAAIYYPLQVFAECWAPLQDALGWYVEMWL